MMMLQDVVGATAAGCASTFIGHPLDTIKVHLQTQPLKKGLSNKNNTLHAARKLLKSHGPTVFWRGVGPPLANAIIMNTVMFSVFHKVKDSSSSQNNKSNSFLAGLLSGIATACISTPTDHVKIQSQLHGMDSVSVLKKTITNPWVLFRGHVANLGREGIFTMVYLGLYYDICRGDDDGTNLLLVTATSFMTGGLAWVASYPFDTVKSVIQSSPAKKRLSTRNAIRLIMNRGESPMSAFYRGCGASTGRAMLVTSTRMLVYEGTRGLFEKNAHTQP